MRTRCSGGMEVKHRTAPARGIWLVPASCEGIVDDMRARTVSPYSAWAAAMMQRAWDRE